MDLGILIGVLAFSLLAYGVLDSIMTARKLQKLGHKNPFAVELDSARQFDSLIADELRLLHMSPLLNGKISLPEVHRRPAHWLIDYGTGWKVHLTPSTKVPGATRITTKRPPWKLILLLIALPAANIYLIVPSLVLVTVFLRRDLACTAAALDYELTHSARLTPNPEGVA